MLDPISDMLTRIRNAQMAGHTEVLIPASKLKLSIAEILMQREYIEAVKSMQVHEKPYLNIVLKYDRSSRTRKEPAIREIKRISKEGQRIYVKHDEIRKIKNGIGLAIISTSQGVMAGEEAHKKGLGGEYVCEVW
jgi:small subunit ribosomal protein S8